MAGPEKLVLIKRHVPRCAPPLTPSARCELWVKPGGGFPFPHTSFPSGSGSPAYPFGKPLPAVPGRWPTRWVFVWAAWETVWNTLLRHLVYHGGGPCTHTRAPPCM